MRLITTCGTLRDSRKKPNAGSLSTGSFSTAMLYRGLEKNGMIGDDMGAAWQV
jgi:hypothetical protein